MHAESLSKVEWYAMDAEKVARCARPPAGRIRLYAGPAAGCLGNDQAHQAKTSDGFMDAARTKEETSFSDFFCLGYTLLKSFCLGVNKFKSPKNGRTVQFVWLGHFLRFIHRMG